MLKLRVLLTLRLAGGRRHWVGLVTVGDSRAEAPHDRARHDFLSRGFCSPAVAGMFGTREVWLSE